MNYDKHYEKLVSRARGRILTSAKERHHVVPRCLGGSDDIENLVYLTPEEHFTAHLLLVKIFPMEQKLVYAANMMCVASRNTVRSNKQYGWLKRRYIHACTQRIGKLNGSFGKPWYHDPKTGKASKFSPGEEPIGWILGRVKQVFLQCKGCSKCTGSKNAKWCASCRPKKQKIVFRNTKTKNEFSDAEKIQALRDNDFSIRRALLSLGLNDSGPNYKMMKELKASLYPLATNQLKG